MDGLGSGAGRAVEARIRRDTDREGGQRERDGGRGAHFSCSACRRLRSATIRTSTPGRSSMSRWGSGVRSRAMPRAHGCGPSRCRWCAAGARPARGRWGECRIPRATGARRGSTRADVVPRASVRCPRTVRGWAGGSKEGPARRRGVALSATRAARAVARPGAARRREQALADRAGCLCGHALLAGTGSLSRCSSLVPDFLRHLPERHFPQSGQILDAEEVVQRGVDPFERIDLAGAEPIEQCFRR